jgi:hypothetical protein
VRGRVAHGPHLEERDLDAALRCLGRFSSGESAADNKSSSHSSSCRFAREHVSIAKIVDAEFYLKFAAQVGFYHDWIAASAHTFHRGFNLSCTSELMCWLRVLDEAQPPARLGPAALLEADNGLLDAAKDQRRNSRIKKVLSAKADARCRRRPNGVRPRAGFATLCFCQPNPFFNNTR